MSEQKKIISNKKNWKEVTFYLLSCMIVTFSLSILIILIIDVVIDGSPRLNWEFLTGMPSRRPANAGILPAIAGSISMMLLTAVISFPIGVGAAFYLEEYAQKNKLTKIIELNIQNLAAIPSVIYGLLGLQVFVRNFGLGRSLLAGALTMSLLVLPMVILSSREAIKRVPSSIREAAFALGASRWEMIKDHIFPMALPGILTACILAFSRAIGETAPLVAVGALSYVAFLPDGIFSNFTVLPIQIFNWVSRPQKGFHQNAAAAIVVLLCLLFLLNMITVILRAKFEKRIDR